MWALIVWMGMGCAPKHAVSGRDAEALVDRVVTAVGAQDWATVLAVADPSLAEVQLGEVGIGRPQFVAELLGLHSEGNSLDVDADGLDAADLGRLRSLSPRRPWARRADGAVIVTGEAAQEGGRVLRFELTIQQTEWGLRLTGGVG